MCTFTASDGKYALSKKQNRIEISRKEKKAKKRKVKRREAKQRKERRRKKKTGVQGGVPLCAADKNFPKERKNKRTCNERKNNKEEKAGVKRMPTHNLANRRTPDHI